MQDSKKLVEEAPYHPGYEDAVVRSVPSETLKDQETKAFLQMAEAMKALEQQLAEANHRIRQLEAQIYNGSTM